MAPRYTRFEPALHRGKPITITLIFSPGVTGNAHVSPHRLPITAIISLPTARLLQYRTPLPVLPYMSRFAAVPTCTFVVRSSLPHLTYVHAASSLSGVCDNLEWKCETRMVRAAVMVQTFH
jgi:hypothetical protein